MKSRIDPFSERGSGWAYTSKTFTVHVNDDSVVEATEHFRVMIARKTTDGSGQALDISDINIEDDDGPPATKYVMTPSSTTKTEGNTTITFTVGSSVSTLAKRCPSIGRPAIGCSTLCRSDFIRVPLPAARMMAATG